MKNFVWMIVPLLAAMFARGEELPAVLAEGEPRIPPNVKWHLVATNDVATIFTYERASISPGPIIQAKTTALQKDLWRTFAGVSSTGIYSSGDAVLITCRARCLETTNSSSLGLIRANFENAVPPYPKLFTAQFDVPKEWTRFFFPLTLTSDIAQGKGKVIFNLGYAVQTVELCDVQMYRFPPGFDLTRLPKSVFKQDKR